MMSSGKDHAVFLRFSRGRLITRRRNVGFQALVFNPPSFTCASCHRCGRSFASNKWSSFLCHCCGFLFCTKCSEVIERERMELRIEFVRLCCDCLKMVNKWSDTDMLMQYAISPWVLSNSTCQLALNLVDNYQSREHLHPAINEFLEFFNNCEFKRSVDPNSNDVLTAYHQSISGLDDSKLLGEDDDVVGGGESSSLLISTDPSSSVAMPPFSHALSAVLEEEVTPANGNRATIILSKELIRETSLRFLQISPVLQQCFEVSVKELPIDQCLLAEQDGTRSYPLVYDATSEIPELPHDFFIEKTRLKYLAKYKLVESDRRNLEVMAEGLDLYCELAAKELNASTAFVSVATHENQLILATNHSRKSSWLQSNLVISSAGLGAHGSNNNNNNGATGTTPGTTTGVGAPGDSSSSPGRRKNSYRGDIDVTTITESDLENDPECSVNGNNGNGGNGCGNTLLFGNFEMFSSLPFLIRHAALDVRFRNFDTVRNGHVAFLLSVPIQCRNVDDPTGNPITLATLCVTDQKPRKSITTMQYTVMKLLATLIMHIWDRRHAAPPPVTRRNFH